MTLSDSEVIRLRAVKDAELLIARVLLTADGMLAAGLPLTAVQGHTRYAMSIVMQLLDQRVFLMCEAITHEAPRE